MAFGDQARESVQSSGRTIDWDGLNKHVVESAGLEEVKTVVGVVSGIVGLGVQQLEDASRELKGDETEESVLEKFPGNYIKEIDGKRMVCWKQPPMPTLALVIDFPGIEIDKGKFFGGEEEPKRLRLILNGEFNPGGGKVVSRPLNFRHTTELGSQSISPKNTLYKMAMDSSLIKGGEAFPADRIGELLGKAYLFRAQVHFKKDKYYTEYCKFLGGLMEGLVAPVIPEDELTLVQVDEKNDLEMLKELRASIRNTIMRSPEYGNPTYTIKAELEEVFPDMKDKYQKYLDSKVEKVGDENNPIPNGDDEESNMPQFIPEEDEEESDGIELPEAPDGDEEDDTPY